MLRKETMLVITFRTTTEAMAMEARCKAEAAPGRLIPVPRSISAGCGMAWCAGPEYEGELRALMARCSITPEALQTCLI